MITIKRCDTQKEKLWLQIGKGSNALGVHISQKEARSLKKQINRFNLTERKGKG